MAVVGVITSGIYNGVSRRESCKGVYVAVSVIAFKSSMLEPQNVVCAEPVA